MGNVKTREEEKLMQEIRMDAVAYTLLKEKARWECMPLFATLREWGDPRKWEGYPRG